MGLSYLFTISTFCGIWRPLSWSSRFKKVLYNMYSVFVVCMNVTFTISQIISVLTVDNLDDFAENTYMLVPAIVCCCKLINLLVYRGGIIELVKIFLEEPCATLNDKEELIQMRYDKQIRTNIIKYTRMVKSSTVMILFTSFLNDFRNGRLTYRAWIPYNYSSTTAFGLTYIHQMMALAIAGYVHLACDVLLCGLLSQICCQFDILQCRLNEVKKNETIALRECVRHHNRIYKLAAMVNDTLNLTIFAQFFGSFLALCLSLIKLIKENTLSTQVISLLFFVVMIMTQSFLYCWYGNEVTLKSIAVADMIFQMNWIETNEQAKKILIITMSRSRSPIQLETAHVMTCDLDFFVAVSNNFVDIKCTHMCTFGIHVSYGT
ncbi:PREDICTED: odorant receptor 94a-like [Dufourea novaeangliae]|uniref:odorant receptor 94a-like n=1 Tax=Dufourea novaeangliae TaxID=178035 RepID=UPI000766F882|nr:PREDICTED: odorant receptor 94a-like [Dufourea novaeangliae]